MEELEKRLADSLLFHIDTVRKQHTRIRDDSYAIDFLRREKWIQKLEFKNRLLGVSKEIKN